MKYKVKRGVNILDMCCSVGLDFRGSNESRLHLRSMAKFSSRLGITRGERGYQTKRTTMVQFHSLSQSGNFGN